ncbi:girdin-like [Maniola hyperantus]|uniref:girdin-like n=1 Tax=Aphantopus hyperantus TaxID=2795564 RepID=UPI003749CF0F
MATRFLKYQVMGPSPVFLSNGEKTSPSRITTPGHCIKANSIPSKSISTPLVFRAPLPELPKQYPTGDRASLPVLPAVLTNIPSAPPGTTEEVPHWVRASSSGILRAFADRFDCQYLNHCHMVHVLTNQACLRYSIRIRKLTENQKEKLQWKREDIPAMYQDLSQSQDEFKLTTWKTDSQDTKPFKEKVNINNEKAENDKIGPRNKWITSYKDKEANEGNVGAQSYEKQRLEIDRNGVGLLGYQVEIAEQALKKLVRASSSGILRAFADRFDCQYLNHCHMVHVLTNQACLRYSIRIRKLTENQKEKLQWKREDIPAMYQDLSQSQDEFKLTTWKTDSQDTKPFKEKVNINNEKAENDKIGPRNKWITSYKDKEANEGNVGAQSYEKQRLEIDRDGVGLLGYQVEIAEQALKKLVRASSSGILRAFADRFDCQYLNHCHMVHVLTNQACLRYSIRIRKLTENQKEKLQWKREDIPAMYQDLSQSQDEFKLTTWKTDSQDTKPFKEKVNINNEKAENDKIGPRNKWITSYKDKEANEGNVGAQSYEKQRLEIDRNGVGLLGYQVEIAEQALKKLVRASSSGILRAFADRFDCQYLNHCHMVHVLTNQACLRYSIRIRKLTENQKEKLQWKREDIPAMYQDLSQSQDEFKLTTWKTDSQDTKNGEEFVVVKSNWKFNRRKLTENQKEKLQWKREDIPAMYQALSQSQDEFKLTTWKTDSQDTKANEGNVGAQSYEKQRLEIDRDGVGLLGYQVEIAEQALKKLVRASSSGILRAFADRFDCQYLNHCHMVHVLTNQACLRYSIRIRKLTENQKEKLQWKREDIPAMYQDLSQSQDEFKLTTWKTDSQDTKPFKEKVNINNEKAENDKIGPRNKWITSYKDKGLLQLGLDQDAIVCAVYRPPSTNKVIFATELRKHISNFHHKHNILLLGDTNIDLKNNS